MTARLPKPISTLSCNGPTMERPKAIRRMPPLPVTFVTGWNIGNPDLVIEMPKAYTVPAKGTIDYTYYVIPTGFTEDKWVQIRRGPSRAIARWSIMSSPLSASPARNG